MGIESVEIIKYIWSFLKRNSAAILALVAVLTFALNGAPLLAFIILVSILLFIVRKKEKKNPSIDSKP